ncbi:MAG: hypothetical protein ACLSX0_01820 [Anaerostipes caccae]|jgi:hypothetical protein
MAEEIFLLDGWKQRGTTYEDFVEAIRYMDDHTKFETVMLEQLDLLHVMREQPDEKLRVFQFVTDDETKHTSVATRVFREESLKEFKNIGALMKEAKVTNHTMYRIRSRASTSRTLFGEYFVSRTLRQPLERGREFLRPRFSRDYAAHADMHSELYGKTMVTLVTRTDGEIQKLFAVHSDAYVPIRQEALIQISEKLSGYFGKVKMNAWQINHQLSSAVLEFPEKEEEMSDLYHLPDTFTPGVHIAISDTARSSLTVQGCFKVGNSFFYTKKCSKKHSGRGGHQEMLERLLLEVDQNIFSEYAALPKRLGELLQIDIKNPEGAVRNVVQKIGFRNGKQLGEKITNQIENQLVESINPKINYTAYDIVMLFLTLPENVISGLKESAMEKLQNLVSGAPWIAFEDQEEQTNKVVIA